MIDWEKIKRQGGRTAAGAAASSAQSYAGIDWERIRQQGGRTKNAAVDSQRDFDNAVQAYEKVYSYMEKNKGYVDDWYGSQYDKELAGYERLLNGYQTGLGSEMISPLREALGEQKSFSSQFDNAEKYNYWLEGYNRWQTQQSSGVSGKQWATDAQSAYDSASDSLSQLEEQYKTLSAESILGSQVWEGGTYMGEDEERKAWYEDELGKLQAQIDGAKQTQLEAQRELEYASQYRYSDYTGREDFKAKSAEGLSAYEADSINSKVDTMQKVNNYGLTYLSYDTTSPSGQIAMAIDLMRADTTYKEPTDQWTEEQKAIYGYLYATDREEADRYGTQLNNYYNAEGKKEEIQGVENWAKKNFWTGTLATLGSIASAPLHGAEYLADLMEYSARGTITEKPYMGIYDYSSTATGAVAENLNQKYGTLDEGLAIIGGKGLGDAYQLGTSIIQSTVSALTFGKLGTLAVYFGTAAKSGLENALDRGASPEQALLSGFAQGCAEVIFEEFSIDHLIKMGMSGTLKTTILNILKQGGIEASEEALTSIANIITDGLIMGDKSELNAAIYSYMMDGMSYEEAQRKAYMDQIESVAFDALGGFVSGIGSGSIASGGNKALSYMTPYQGNSQQLVGLAKDSENADLQALGKKMSDRVENGKSLSNAQANKLIREISKADVQTITQAAEEQLKALGETGNIELKAAAIAKTAAGEELTRAEKKALDQSRYGQRLLNELNPENILSGEYRSGWAEKLNTKIINAPFYSLDKLVGTSSADKESTGEGIKVENKDTPVQTSSGKGTLSGIDTEGRVVIKTEDGEAHLELEEANLPEDVRALVDALIPLGKSADAAFKAYDGSMDVQEYAAAWDAAENLFAANGAFRSALDESILTRGLNPVQREIAYDYGRRTYEAKKAELEKGREKTTPQLHEAERATARVAPTVLTRGDTERGKGSVSYEGGTVDGVTYKAVDRKKLTERQKTQAAVAEAMAEATGLDFVLFEGDAKGKQGIYVPGGTIYLNINAGAAISKNLMVQTMAHELTHFIQENAESEYQELKDYVVSQLLLSGGGKLETLVLNKQKEWSGLSYSEALDEVVADGCEMMLKSSKAVQQLAAENRSLAGRIGQWIKDFVRRLKTAFKGVEARHEEARILMRHAEDMQKMWDRALVQAVHSRDAQGSKKAATEGGSVKYSIRDEFSNEIDNWDGKSKKVFNVGTTSEALKSIGVKDRGITWYGGKIAKIMKEHRGMTKEVIKQVPQILEHPVVVLASQNNDSRLVIFGTVNDSEGIPVTAILELQPTTKGGQVLDLNIIASAYGKDNNIKGFVERSGLVYLDVNKNRTQNWLQSVGLQLPSDATALGSIGRVSYPDGKVKIESVPYKQYIQNITKNDKAHFSLWDEGVSDRELLLDAATEENASDAVLAYARKYKAYEGLLRREERLRARLEAARAAEQGRMGSDVPSGTPAPTNTQDDNETTPPSPPDGGATSPYTGEAMKAGKTETAESIEEKLKKCREDIARTEERLARLEAGAELRREADKAREKWFNRNMAEAVKTNRQIREENAELKRYVESYRRQMKRTKPGEERARTEDINRLAKALLKEHGSGLDSSYLARRLQKLGDYIVSNNGGEGISYQELRRAARSIAKDIAENSIVEVDDSRELRKEIRDYLKDTRLKISDELKGDIPDFEAFRRSNFGTLRLSKDGRSIDSVYQEMGVMFGEGLFPQDILAHSDMIQQILDTLDSLRPRQEPAYSRYEIQEVTNLMGEEIIDSLLSGDVQQAETAADRNYREMAARIAEVNEKALSDRERLLEERKIRRKLVQEKVAELQVRMDEKREKRQKRVNIDRLANRLTRMLTENSAKNHIPETMKADIANFLLSVDNLSPRAGEKTREKYLANMTALQKIVADQRSTVESGDGEGNFPMLDLPEFIRDDLDSLVADVRRAVQEDREWTVSRMNLADLERLERILTVLSTSVSHAVDKIALAGNYRINELSQESMEFLKEIGDLKGEGKIKQFAREYLSWDNTVPVYAFKRFGPGGERIFKGIVRGWSSFAMNAKQVLDFTEQAYTAEYAREAENTVYEFQLYKRLVGEDSGETTPQSPAAERATARVAPTALTRGATTGESSQYNSKGDGLPLHSENRETVRMSKAQVMGLYCLMKRQKAQGHILGAGIRVSDFSDSKKKTVHQAENYLVSIEDFANIVKVLSEEDMKVANSLMEYMNTVGSDWGNEVSMKRFGIRAFTEENYYPIRTDDRSRDSRTPEGDRGGLYRLLNMSFTKNTVKNANNAVVIDSIFDVFANHMADMAKYNALSLPIIDAMKWFNFRETSGKSESGQFTTDNVKKSLERVYGKQAEKYFITFMQDLNGSKEGGRGESALKRVVSNYKVAAVGANLRVALQQPTSIMRAALQLNGKYIVKGAAMKGGIEKARKYSGLAVWKDMGYYDVNINRGLREKIKHTETKADWLREKSMILAEQGDKITWGTLWNACELETKEKTGLSGDELMQATAERFDEVILTTQVMDSTISRSQNMRSTSLAMSELTGFMSEPTLTYNTILDAYTDFMLEKRRNTGKAWEKTRGKIGRTFAVYILTSAFTAAAAAIADACRDDDEYETWVEKWLEHFWENFKDNSNPLKLVPVVSQLYEVLVEGESQGSMLFEPMERLRSAYDVAKETVGLFAGWIDEPTEVTYFGKMTGWGKVYKLIQAAGTLSGIPAGSAAREVVAIWNTTFGSWLNLKLKTYDPGPEGEIKDAFLAGYLTEEEAEALLWDKALAKSREDAAQTVYKWSLDGAGVFDAAVSAARAGDSEGYAAAIAELKENSYAERDAQSEIRSAVKDWYQGTEDEKKSIDKQGAIKRLVSFGGMSQKDAEALVQQWTAKVATGIDYDRIDEAFINREISASRAESLLQTYGGKTADEAKEKVLEWQCERDTGIAYSELQDAYDAGQVSASKAETMLQKYGGKSEDEAADTLIRWDFIDGNEELKGISTDGAKEYTEYCENTGMSKNTYYEAWKAMNQFKSDVDENGNTIQNSKKNKILAFIDALPISTEQKDALYRVNDYSESNLKYAPWHQG